jgi:hypothetical protein
MVARTRPRGLAHAPSVRALGRHATTADGAAVLRGASQASTLRGGIALRAATARGALEGTYRAGIADYGRAARSAATEETVCSLLASHALARASFTMEHADRPGSTCDVLAACLVTGELAARAVAKQWAYLGSLGGEGAPHCIETRYRVTVYAEASDVALRAGVARDGWTRLVHATCRAGPVRRAFTRRPFAVQHQGRRPACAAHSAGPGRSGPAGARHGPTGATHRTSTARTRHCPARSGRARRAVAAPPATSPIGRGPATGAGIRKASGARYAALRHRTAFPDCGVQ